MSHRVVGYIFNDDGSGVLLDTIEGAVGDAEHPPVRAVIRLMRLKYGIDTLESDWKQFHFQIGKDVKTGLAKYFTYHFKCFSTHYLSKIKGEKALVEPLVSPMEWLIPLALDQEINHSYSSEVVNAVQPEQDIYADEDRLPNSAY